MPSFRGTKTNINTQKPIKKKTIYMQICTKTHILKSTNTHMCIYQNSLIHIKTHSYIIKYAGIQAIHILTYIYIQIHTNNLHIHMHIYTPTHTYTQTHLNTQKQAHMHKSTHTHKCIYTYVDIHMCTLMHTYL